MVGGRAVPAEGGFDRQPAADGPAGGIERHPLSRPLRLRMADAADPFPALADGVLVVSPSGPPSDVSDHPRDRPDDRPGARRPYGGAERGGALQPISQGPGRAGHTRL